MRKFLYSLLVIPTIVACVLFLDTQGWVIMVCSLWIGYGTASVVYTHYINNIIQSNNKFIKTVTPEDIEKLLEDNGQQLH